MGIEIETQILHETIRKSINLERLIKSVTFIKMYNSAGENEQNTVEFLIRALQYESVKSWIKRIRNKQLSTMSIRDLRFLASNLQIKQYAHMQKDDLRRAIEEIQNGNGRAET